MITKEAQKENFEMSTEQILKEIGSIRNWAGDNLPANGGLTLVAKLEKLIKEIKKETEK